MILVALLVPLAWLLVGMGVCSARLCLGGPASLGGLRQPVGFVSELSIGPKMDRRRSAGRPIDFFEARGADRASTPFGPGR